MTPVLPQVDPVPLPGPPLLFWLLLMLTFTLHALAMNAVLGGAVIGAAARWRALGGRPHHARLAALIGKWMPLAISTAVTLGVAALLFLQVLYGRVFFSSSVLMARVWIAVVPLLIAGYYAAYAIAMRPDTPRRTVLLALVSAGCFATIAFILSNNMGLMLNVERLPSLFAENARGTHLNTADATMLPRYLHMLLGAVAVAGLMIAAAGAAVRTREPGFGPWALRWGTGWFASATALNFGVGVWWLGVLPPDVLRQLLGGNALATAVLVAGIASLLGSFGLSMTAAQSREPARWVAGAAAALVAGVVLMLLTRDFIRGHRLAAAGFELPRWVVPQWPLIAAFFLLFAVAVAVVFWMARRLRQAATPI